MTGLVKRWLASMAGYQVISERCSAAKRRRVVDRNAVLLGRGVPLSRFEEGSMS